MLVHELCPVSGYILRALSVHLLIGEASGPCNQRTSACQKVHSIIQRFPNRLFSRGLERYASATGLRT